MGLSFPKCAQLSIGEIPQSGIIKSEVPFVIFMHTASAFYRSYNPLSSQQSDPLAGRSTLRLEFCQLIDDKLQYLRITSFPKTYLHFRFCRVFTEIWLVHQNLAIPPSWMSVSFLGFIKWYIFVFQVQLAHVRALIATSHSTGKLVFKLSSAWQFLVHDLKKKKKRSVPCRSPLCVDFFNMSLLCSLYFLYRLQDTWPRSPACVPVAFHLSSHLHWSV